MKRIIIWGILIMVMAGIFLTRKDGIRPAEAVFGSVNLNYMGSGNLKLGGTTVVTIQVKTGTNKINGIDANFTFDKNKLQVLSIEPIIRPTTTSGLNQPMFRGINNVLPNYGALLDGINSNGAFNIKGISLLFRANGNNFVAEESMANAVANLSTGNVDLVKVTFKDRGVPGQATLRLNKSYAYKLTGYNTTGDDQELSLIDYGTAADNTFKIIISNTVTPTKTIIPPPTTPVPVTEVAACKGTVSYYSMDQSKGDVVGDSTGNNHGTATGTKVVAGKINLARMFSGISPSNITIPSVFNLKKTNVSIGAWVNIPNISDKGAIVKIGDRINGYGMGVGKGNWDTAGNNLILLYENSRWIDTKKTIGTGWHYITMIIDNSGYPLAYLDGSLIYSDKISNAIVVPAGSTRIGGYDIIKNRFLTATIDEVGIWNRTLNSQEVARLAGGRTCHPAIFINSGSSDDLSINDLFWQKDRGFSGGSVLSSPGSNTNTPNKEQRYWNSNTVGSNYSIPLSNGNYLVNLLETEYSSEITRPGQRVFDANVEGVVMTGIDIFKLAGGRNKTIKIPFSVTVADGLLDIKLTRRAQNTQIDGIEILPVPIGHFDSANCTSFIGWACDSENVNQTIKVDFYKDGLMGAGGTFSGSTTASLPREAKVGGLCGGNSSHGFVFTPTSVISDGKSHDIYAYAKNPFLATGGPDTLLNSMPIRVSCSTNPVKNTGL